MTVVVLHSTLMFTGLIRKAEKCGAITRHEADYLIRMAQDSFPAVSTTALVRNKGAPDFLYAALYFSTMLWQSGEAAEDDVKAGAGYKLAQFVLSQESPAHDSYWAAKLLRELYNAHEESTQNLVDYVA